MSKCKECGVEFKPKNKKAKFCSPKCRQKDYRKTTSEILKAAREIKFKGVTHKSFDGKRINKSIIDETSQFKSDDYGLSQWQLEQRKKKLGF